MATVSFAKKSTPDLETKPLFKKPAVAEETAPARVEASAVACLSQSPQLQGEFTARDMAIPFLNLGQKSGTMCDEHPDWVGKFVFDKACCLGADIRLVVCRLKKRYEEVTEFGGPDIPQMFDTIAAAQQAGVEVRDVAEIDLLLQCETEEMEQFTMLEAEGKAYAPARYVVRSSAYGRTVGIILKDLAGWLKNDLASGFYRATTEKRTGNGNSWFVPKLSTDGKVSDALRSVIREKFGV